MTVLEAVNISKTPVFMNKGAIKAAQDMLAPSEEVIWAQTSNVYADPVRGELSTDIKISDTNALPGVVVVTDRRILFVYKMLSNSSSKEVRISDIRSIDTKANFTFEVIRIVGTSSMIVTYAKRQVIANLKNAINDAISKQKTNHTPSATQVANYDTLDTSDIEQLQALKQLYDSGVLTAEEFAAKKAQILDL